jgi:hypothetical protein
MRYFRLAGRSLAALAIALAVPVAASAQVMTFAQTACTQGNYHSFPSTYTEAGYTLVTPGNAGFASWCNDSDNYAGVGMFINSFDGTAQLTQNGGGTFAIKAIELSYFFGGSWPAQPFTFFGNLSGGGTISQTFTIGPQLGGHPTFVPFIFDAQWTNLASVDFSVNHWPGYQFTNVSLESSVPEPASMALFGTGLVGVFGFIRRRRSN